MQNNKWLTLSEYSNSYKVSVSTLRRRIKSKKVNCVYEDGKYYLENLPLSDHRLNNTQGDLTHHQLTPKATTAPPQNFSSQEDDIAMKSEAMPPVNSSDIKNEISPEVLFMVTELKNAYTLNLKEKEEQILVLKDEITDLKMLVHALEQQVEGYKAFDKDDHLQEPQSSAHDVIESIQPEPIELEYIPTPAIELANDWLEDDL